MVNMFVCIGHRKYHTISISQYCHLKLWCQSYYSFRLSRGKVSPIIDDIWEPSLLQYNDVHITYSLSYTFNAYSEIHSVKKYPIFSNTLMAELIQDRFTDRGGKPALPLLSYYPTFNSKLAQVLSAGSLLMGSL